ncbi:MAG TPA: type III-B CRISPR module-associated Cmr3 family protein [Verrucomicrobiota bacterium]|nr:type III-B CRISPR module-associated Cmr3 family protein [Verrucomicrobiota bacterium]HQB17905.1 type III-B CRISPR module-associated Cmr3 family protein [Verrucomicrobiota bacterium]
MNPLLIEPTDVLFFRDAVPMSAGQGKGAGCRLPFPSTLHEAFRGSLLRATGGMVGCKQIEGRPRAANRTGNWHVDGHDGRTFIATKAYRSLRTIGPLPYQNGQLLLPVPNDVVHTPDKQLARLQLWRDAAVELHQQSVPSPVAFRPPCLPVAVTPPDKHGLLSGWWNTAQYRAYLDISSTPGEHKNNPDNFFLPLPTADLWAAEQRVGVQIDPGSFASAEGQLYAGSYLRANKHTRFMAWAEVADPQSARNGEAEARRREREQLARLDWLLLGGEFRLARLWHQTENRQAIPDPLGELRLPPAPPPGDGPYLLKWVLVTPAIFAHGSLPGWCWNATDGRPPGEVRLGASKRKTDHQTLPGRAQLISWCLSKPRTVSGFDVVEGRAKPTLLAVPEGGVYYFLCENRDTATALAKKLHWQPRSDFYGEKGCGYGLVSFDVQMHQTSADVPQLAKELFTA